MNRPLDRSPEKNAQCSECNTVLSSVLHYRGDPSCVIDHLIWCSNAMCSAFGVRVDLTSAEANRSQPVGVSIMRPLEESA